MQANSYVCDLQPYQPGKPIEEVVREFGHSADQIVKLASNENPLGMGTKAQEALKQAAQEGHRYPEQYGLVQALAQYYGLQDTQIVIGNGSNDVLDLIARTFLDGGDEAIMSQYAFVVYELATRSTGAIPVVVPVTGYGHDLQAMLAAITAQTKIIWIANPNNPTGTFIPYDQIETFISRVPDHIVVVLDEAYYEYLPPQERANSVQWLHRFPNLILVRTFSKIHGLAGLRIGYGLMHDTTASLLNRVRQPFNGNRLGLAAATAALQDTAFLRQSYDNNQMGRKQLTTGLRDMGVAPIKGQGNFITFQIPQAAAIVKKMLERGVIVRPLAAYGMTDHIRVTIGTKAENAQFLATLKSSM